MPLEQQMEERFKEKFSNMPLFSIVENGKRKLVYGAILAFIQQERQRAKKEVLGEVDKRIAEKREAYRESGMREDEGELSALMSLKRYLSKEINITLE